MRVKAGVVLLLTGVIAACNLPKESTIGVRAPTHDEGEVVSPPKKDEPGRHVTEAERWILSDAQSVKDLKDTEFGEREIREFWTRKGWRMTKKEERYLAETRSLLDRGVIESSTRWAMCPYTSVYRALRSTRVMGVAVTANQEFHFEMCENENEVQLGRPLFRRLSGYKEDHGDGHATDPSKKPDDH